MKKHREELQAMPRLPDPAWVVSSTRGPITCQPPSALGSRTSRSDAQPPRPNEASSSDMLPTQTYTGTISPRGTQTGPLDIYDTGMALDSKQDGEPHRGDFDIGDGESGAC